MSERDFEEVFDELMRNPETLAAYEAATPRWDFADLLSECRQKAGMSVKELAKKSGISKNKILRYESADGDPTVREMQALAHALDKKLVIKFLPRDEDPAHPRKD